MTAICPTLVTSPNLTYHKVLPKIKKRKGGKHGAEILGVHVEGPFISIDKKGAHPEICIKQFNEVILTISYYYFYENYWPNCVNFQGFKTLTDVYGSLENICYITLAPEIPNALSVIEELSKRNIKVSLGNKKILRYIKIFED